jgi:hypothetical protein
MLFKAKQKLLTITIDIQLIPYPIATIPAIYSGAIALTREHLDREVKECQHEFVTLNASS